MYQATTKSKFSSTPPVFSLLSWTDDMPVGQTQQQMASAPRSFSTAGEMQFNCPDQTQVQRDSDATLPSSVEVGRDSDFLMANTVCNKVLPSIYEYQFVPSPLMSL